MPATNPESDDFASPVALRHIVDVVEQTHVAVSRDRDTAQSEILDRLVAAAEAFEGGACHHGQNTGRVSALIFKALGMTSEQCEMLQRAAQLHDIGKVGIPQSIVAKPGKLEPDEYEAMKQHAVVGARILERSPFPLVRMAHDIALTHHERWDGSGYPWGKHGDNIPLVGQVVGIADVWDALTHKRTYKEAWHHTKAADEIQSLSGRSFGPLVVDAFMGCYKQGLFVETHLHQI